MDLLLPVGVPPRFPTRPTAVDRVARSLVAIGLSVILAGCGNGAEPRVRTTDTADSTARASDAVPESTGAAADTVADRPPTTIRVPADAPTIQQALDRTVPGDLVLIDAGTYTEALDVQTPGVTIRGVDRNTVVLDGNDELENGIKVAADRVAVENLTVRRYTFNGVLFTKAYDDNADDPTQHTVLQGYRASYLTLTNNGQYGVYAFFARGGRMDHLYVSGHPDSGVYLGQCKPCDAVITDVLAENNSMGYQGTNSGGNVYVINSVWRANRVGLTITSQDMERLAPQEDTVVAGNVVTDNDNAGAPATAQGAFGVGIAIAGGTKNRVLRNRVGGHPGGGIVVTVFEAWKPSDNLVGGNALTTNGVDLVFDPGRTGGERARNCFTGNRFTTSTPSQIESALPCGDSVTGVLATPPAPALPAPPDVDYRTVPGPGPQPTMPGDPSAPPDPVADQAPAIDVDAIDMPKEEP